MARPMLVASEDAVSGSTDRKSTRLNSSHLVTSYAVFCLTKIPDAPHARPARYLGPSQIPPATPRAPLSRQVRARPRRPLIHRDVLSPDIVFFFFNDTATTEIYTLSLHDALPI